VPEGSLVVAALSGEYGAVLSQLGQNAEALAQYERALSCELDQGNADDSSSVALARYFAGEAALKNGDPNRALATITPSVGKTSKFEALLRIVEADALRILGRRTDALRVAAVALATAESEKRRIEIRIRLGDLLDEGG
jgi:tetratricopeptide (TPR) repeat protein